jgi:hypothetical protein
MMMMVIQSKIQPRLLRKFHSLNLEFKHVALCSTYTTNRFNVETDRMLLSRAEIYSLLLLLNGFALLGKCPGM